MTENWFCYINGKVRGPFNAGIIGDMAKRGQLKPVDQVRRGDDGEWCAASSIRGLTFGTSALISPQPQSGSVESFLPPPSLPSAGGSVPKFVYKNGSSPAGP